MTYTKQHILKAAELGEVSMIDAEHICALLDDAVEAINNPKGCRECKHLFTNPFDQHLCHKGIDFDSVEDCEGELFEKK